MVAINESPTTIGVADSSLTSEEIPSMSREYYRESGEVRRMGTYGR